ncbi:caspase family protein [Aromatoleum toluolicum]|uniref:Caspase family p20 domain-containing protein n=1 Tax=Aromatoleum toluolicum TaxID=90060 RepID=A0ABX1NP16_9RHOO|nr:caspase family protein [Aromatoleum toluolicum]NMG00886.1 caspase family protein [Aromatoleum toluolicum]
MSNAHPSGKKEMKSAHVAVRLTILFLTLIIIHAHPALAQYAFEKEPGRHALVIGNSNYDPFGKLPSASLDGFKVAERLRDLRFSVTHVTDLPSVRHFEDEVLPAFRRPIEPGDLVVFYFSGHGFSYGPTNYLAPIDLPLRIKEGDLPTRAIALENVEDYFVARQPGLVLMVIDACRTIAGFVVSDEHNAEHAFKGVVQPRRPQHNVNTMVAFASRPGYLALASTAQDQLSIFTSRLVEYITREGYEFEQLMKEVGADVSIETNALQQPGMEVWSYSSLYLKPSAAILDQQKLAWNIALESNLEKAIRLFSMRHSVSRHAAAARKWLEDNSLSGLAPRYTLVSPVAVERAWRPVALSSGTTLTPTRVAIVPPTAAFAFRRSLDVEASESVKSLSDRELGLVPSGVTRVAATPSKISRDMQVVLAHADVVTTRERAARTAPSSAAPVAARVPFGTQITVTDVKDLGKEGIWVSAYIPGIANELYLPVRAKVGNAAPIELGRSLREIVVRPQASGIPDLVESRPIGEAISTLKAEGRTVTWISIATAAASSSKEADARTMRRFHVEYLLKQFGIDGRRITAVANAADFSDDGVRVRFFGF